MWYGESQKLIKRVFKDYRKFMKTADKCPILLFNEADAIITKRRDSNSSNTAQTENAIQNIILEELEQFKGILFATTNLVGNIDKAFERRFLFKIELKQPDIANRAAIWMVKLAHLTGEEAHTLAALYNFSGGQIENIMKKAEMNYVLRGVYPDCKQIRSFCDTELLQRVNMPKIGFKSSTADRSAIALHLINEK